MAVVDSSTDGTVGILTINRPEALNAVNDEVIDGLVEKAEAFDADEAIGAIIVTGGGEKAFVAGADIKSMADKSYMDMLSQSRVPHLARFAKIKKPLIAAVNGFALGGGCEIAMMCDIVVASQKAKFGQPEIRLGIIPGWGGTQRLAHAVGKAKAMDLVLTGRMMDAEEAERAGLVSRIVAPDDLMETALEIGRTIGDFSAPSVRLAKEAVNRAFETSLEEGLLFEQRLFFSLFATEDQTEGMTAFIEKRQANFRNR